MLLREMGTGVIDAMEHLDVLRALRLESTLEIALVIDVCAAAAHSEQRRNPNREEIRDAHSYFNNCGVGCASAVVDDC